MKMPLSHKLLLALPLLTTAFQAPAQPNPIAQFKADTNQCLQAKTASLCKDALSACQRIHDTLAALPPEPKLRLAQAQVLHHWAWCEEPLGHYAQAEGHLRSALTLRQKLLGREHPDLAVSLNNLAGVLDRQGRYGEAEVLYRQALALWQKVLGGEHPNVAGSLNNLAGVLEHQGKYGKAEALYREALALHQKLLGGEHPYVADSLNNLAGVLNNQGKYGEAEPLMRQTLALRKKVLGGEHPDVAASLNNLAEVLHNQAKYGEAELLYRQALALWQKVLGGEHPDVATALNNLAGVLHEQRKYGEAEPLFRQALALLQKLLGGEHPNVAAALNNLAGVLENQGKYGEAEPLFRQALALRQKVLGGEHPAVARSLNNLAGVLEQQAKYGEAEPLYRQAVVLLQKVLGLEHPHVAMSLNNLAGVLENQGKYGEAEPLFRQALALWQKVLGGEHPDVATSLNNLARFQIHCGVVASAVSPLRQAAQIRELQLRATVSETRMQALLDGIRFEEDAIYGLLLLPRLAGVSELALSTALLRKGRVAEAGAAANRVVQGQIDRPDVAKRLADWQSVRQQREALLYSGPGRLSGEDYQRRLQILKLESESLEHLVVAELPELKHLQPPMMDQIVAQVAARLPQDSVLVEVVWTRPYLANEKDPTKRYLEPRYVGMLLFPDRRIVPVDMGAAAAIDPSVRGLLSALSSPGTDAVKAAQAVFAKVMEPLVGELAGRRDLYLSLDGTLNLIPFDALHDGTDYLLGRYRFHYLSSGRDLLRDAAQRTAGAPLLLGNPDFGKAEEKCSAEGSAGVYHRLSGLLKLPGTQREVAAISKLLSVPAQTQSAAREETVRVVHAPRILHIATHGLFLRDVELPASAGPDRGLLSANAFDPPRSNIIPVPIAERLPGELGAMNRSALVLADAARGASAQNTTRDGLLTADEARSLDLYGTQLVVLSACETGQGGLSAGQGIYGLRRAFLVAGAETLVTSLWRVSDEATGELMTRYYEKLLDKKKPGDRLGAMMEAMQEMRKKPGRSHPYYWAPFLVIGQDGPLH